MASKRGPKQNKEEKAPLGEDASLYAPATQMEFLEFVVEFRRRAQGSLWQRADKITVADLARLKELEDEGEKKAERRKPKELRVVWINKRDESTT